MHINFRSFVAATLALSALHSIAVHGAPAAAQPCIVQPAKLVLDKRIALNGTETVREALPGPLPPSLLQVAEEGVDVDIEVLDAKNARIAIADSPIARQGVQYADLPTLSGNAQLVVRAKEHSGVSGFVRVHLSTPMRAREPGGCLPFIRQMAQADAKYSRAAEKLVAAHTPDDSDSSSLDFNAPLNAYIGVALADSDRPGDLERNGIVELSIAAIYYYHLSDYEQSASWAARASASFAAGHESYLQARADALLAAAWIELPNVEGRYDKARELLDRLTEFHGARGEMYDHALQINNVGLAFYNESRFKEAVPFYEAALDAFERLGETPRFALAIQNIALCDWGLGRWQAAAAGFSRSLDLMTPEPYLDIYLLTLNNSAMAHLAGGKLDVALSQHNRAWNLANRAKMNVEVARSLYGIGVTYYAMGDLELSRDLLEQALQALKPRADVVDGAEVLKELDVRARLATLRALATLEQEIGAFDKADEYHDEALRIAKSPNVIARIRLRKAVTSIARKNIAAALEVATPLASRKSNVDALTRAVASAVRAKALRVKGELATSEAELGSAIQSFKKFQARSDEFDAHVELAGIYRATGRRALARSEVREALKAGAELRAQTANPVYRASLASEIRPVLDLAMDLFRAEYEAEFATGNDSRAAALALESLQVVDQLRGQSLHQLSIQRAPDGNSALTSLLSERATLQRDLADRRYYLAVREERSLDDASAIAMREDIVQLRASLDVNGSKIASVSKGVEQSRGLTGIRLPADRDTAQVEYWLGDDTTYAWVVDHAGVKWLKLGRTEKIRIAATALQESLGAFFKSPASDDSRSTRTRLAHELHQLLIRSLGNSLDGARFLTIVPDGALHSVPFAMLRASQRERFLVERFAIRLTPALWLNRETANTPKVASDGRLLLISDPVYQSGDDRLAMLKTANIATQVRDGSPRVRATLDLARLQRLLGSADEAAGIRQQFGAALVDELSGLSAVRERFLERDLKAYRYVHVAAHGSVDGEIPMLSSLVLGAFDNQGRVKDQQIRAGDLLDRQFAADVVVLSACNTSVGRSYAQEGPMGLHYAVLARGAKAVVASMWAVADETTAPLMTEMYRRMVKQGERVDVALAGAMRAEIANHPQRDPALWAPYNTYAVEY